MGDPIPGTETWSWLSSWPFDPAAVAMSLTALALYEIGLRRVRRSGRPFPTSWAMSYRAGIGTLALALLTPIESYAHVSFAVHMGQHLMLILLAPPLLALGAPVTLALRATPPTTARSISRMMSSGAVRFLAHPVVGWGLFIGVSFAFHLSPAFDLSLRRSAVHVMEHVAWLTSALIYWWPIVGRDPAPRKMPYPARMISLFLTMPAMSFLALSIYLADHPLYPTYAGLPAPWGGQALAQQRAGAILMWLLAALAMLLATLIVAVAWKHDEVRAQRRQEAREDGLSPTSPR